MKNYIKPDGSYYQGDREHALDVEVPERPSVTYVWDGVQWAPGPDYLPTLQKELTLAVQVHLDSTAQQYDYDSILSAVSYSGSASLRYRLEGLAFAAWRDAVWEYCTALLTSIQAGQAAIPTATGLVSQLPKFTPPAIA